MSATIQITLAQVNACAHQIKLQNQQLYQNLQEISIIMKQLSSFWQSPASDTIQQRFITMLPEFDNYRMIIDAYSKFLDQTVTTYQNMENRINSSADTF